MANVDSGLKLMENKHINGEEAGILKEEIDKELLEKHPTIKVYKRRWLILALYILYSGANSFQWMEYPIITNIVTRYYNVSSLTVDWTSIIYMALYPIMVLPASYIIDAKLTVLFKGLRVTGLIGCLGTAIAAVIKVFSIGRSRFFVVLLGQAVGSAAQVFILCLPSKLAAVWFKTNEMSTICSVALFGTQIGFALGFVVPSSIVKNHENVENIGWNLTILCWALTFFMIPVSLGMIFFFQSQPKFPPNLTQFENQQQYINQGFCKFLVSFKKLFLEKPFFLHMMAYGINVGVFSAIGTFLNQFILQYFEGAEEDAGRMGLVMIIFGILGSIFFGYLLDKTHKYKGITFFIYLMCALSIVGFMFALTLKLKWLTYLALIIVGIFTSAYMPVGFEFAVELTYPADESTTTGIMIAMTQLMGVVFTLILGKLNEAMGAFWCLGSQVLLLLLGVIITGFVPNELKRQAALKKTLHNGDQHLISNKTNQSTVK